MSFIPFCILAINNEDDCEFMQMLYLDYRKLMYRTALKILHNLPDAEDVINDACMALIKHIDVLRQLNPQVCPSYIVSTVKRQALMHIRRKKIESRALQKVMEINALETNEMEQSVDAKAVYRCTVVETVKAIRTLHPRDQEILQMKFFDHLSDKEIAEILDVQASTVRSKITRARQRLRKALKEDEDDN